MPFAALTLAGCGEDVPERAGTLDEPSANASTETSVASGDDDAPESEDSGEQTGHDFGRAGRQLTKVEAKEALPGVQVLPAGWSVDPESTLTGPDEDDAEDKITPARCKAVFDGLDDITDENPAAESGVTFTAGMLGPFLGVEITSQTEPIPGERLSAMLKALSKCPTFSVDDGTSVAKFQASALSFPNLGEESAALRLQASSDGMTFGLDMVAIRVGHNFVSVSQMNVGGAGSVKPLQKAARATMTSLSE